MQLSFSYDKDFDVLIERLRNKYPEKLFDLEGIGRQLDLNEYSKTFFDSKDVVVDHSIDSNANVDGKDVITFNYERTKPFIKLNSMFLLWKYLKKAEGKEYADEVIEAQISGNIYINDFWDIGRPYCFNYSTYDIATQGLPMISKIISKPPKYLLAFKSQVEQFLGVASNSTLGATGLADLLIVMAWYVDEIKATLSDAHVKFDNHEDVYKYVRELLTSLIYTLNQPLYRGNQSPFTNVSIFDIYFLKELLPKYEIDGRIPKLQTIHELQVMFLSIMNTELDRTPITFPVVTACFSKDEDGYIKDENFLNYISKANEKYGFINIYCGKSSTLSSCCRLRSDTQSEYFNSFGAGSTKIGSLGVVTLNLPRLAAQCDKDRADSTDVFYDRVCGFTEMASKINQAKRMIIQKRIDAGAMPLYTMGHMDIKRQYSTVGITGIYEAATILGYDMLTEEGQEFVEGLLSVVHLQNDYSQKEYGYPHNVEQVPAENSSVKLAAKDTLLGYNPNGYSLYSNQFLPLTADANLIDRITIQGRFDGLFSGGAICHLNLAEKVDADTIENLIKYAASKGVIYFAINYALNRCEQGHMSVGMNTTGKCPICDSPITDTFTRVVGFLTNTKHWNQVRREEEWPHRNFYELPLR